MQTRLDLHDPECPKCGSALIDVIRTESRRYSVIKLRVDGEDVSIHDSETLDLYDSIEADHLICEACDFRGEKAAFIPKPAQRDLTFMALPEDRDGSAYEEDWMTLAERQVNNLPGGEDE